MAARADSAIEHRIDRILPRTGPAAAVYIDAVSSPH